MEKAQEASFSHLLFAQEFVPESFVIYFFAALTLSFSVNSNSVAGVCVSVGGGASFRA